LIEDYQPKRRRARLVARGLLVAGIGLAFVSAALTYVVATRAPAAEAPAPTGVDVLVATRDIAARTVIGPGDVRVARAAPEVVPAGALGQPEAAVGRVATAPIAKNEIVQAGRFAEGAGTGFAVFPVGIQPTGTAPDFRAMSLEIADANAVGGAVQPGDAVDVLFSIPFAPARLGTAATVDTDFAARILAERVAVLARSGTIYTVRLEAAQAERVAALQAAGATLHLLLRAGDDARAPRASGTVFSSEAGAIIRAIPTIAPPR
jgi:pilus assembly protein CpaB